MSVVREEFGPTLPELLGARLRVPARSIWRVLAAAGVVVVLVLAWLVFVRGAPGQTGVVVRGPVTFNLIYTDALHKVAPRNGEVLRLQTSAGPPQSFAVRPLRLAEEHGRATNLAEGANRARNARRNQRLSARVELG